MAKHGWGRALLEGALVGAAGAFAMGPVQALFSRLESKQTKEREQAVSPHPATETAGRRLLGSAGIWIADDVVPRVGQLVHYATGIGFGAVYGLLRFAAPGLRARRGLLFGATIWLFNDELLVTLFRLAPQPTRFPVFTHARALASHLAYGLTVDRGLFALETLG